MSHQANVQRIGAYVWCLILTVAGGALIIGASGGSTGEEPATVLVPKVTPPPIIASDTGGELHTGGSPGITHVSNTE